MRECDSIWRGIALLVTLAAILVNVFAFWYYGTLLDEASRDLRGARGSDPTRREGK